jgi:hypothetical protein
VKDWAVKNGCNVAPKAQNSRFWSGVQFFLSQFTRNSLTMFPQFAHNSLTMFPQFASNFFRYAYTFLRALASFCLRNQVLRNSQRQQKSNIFFASRREVFGQ